MRTFIAIEIPDEIRRGMAEAQRRLKDAGAVDASWPRPEGIHLTLKFLGETPEQNIPEIMTGLRAAAQGTGVLRLEVAGVGTFPNPKNARVVWIGVSGDTERLARLQAAVEGAMARLGLERENRAFTPHLTLGRIKYIRSRDSWLRALDEIKDISLPPFDAVAVSLVKSELKRTGAEYTEIGRVELK
ncbi:MAG TPA: RNA 2',3'-cyclic phosphodiesterase [Nitrospirota bacterium]